MRCESLKPVFDLKTDSAITNVIVGDGVFHLARPADVEALIDSGSGMDQVGNDVTMPYWATLWPVSRALAERIVSCPAAFKGKKTLELGCGLGLAGLAALRTGAEVTFSDYDPNALEFAAHNAKLNGFSSFAVSRFDWRDPPDQLFDVIIGADLAWSPDIVPAFVHTIRRMLRPGGSVWLADQNRLEASSFEKILSSLKLKITHSETLRLDESWGWNIGGTFYEIHDIMEMA
jgi:predicted nicotinamide N-methyase